MVDTFRFRQLLNAYRRAVEEKTRAEAFNAPATVIAIHAHDEREIAASLAVFVGAKPKRRGRKQRWARDNGPGNEAMVFVLTEPECEALAIANDVEAALMW